MNCKPGDLATIVRGCALHRCVGQRIGCPVRVSHLVTPVSLMGAIMEVVDGPTWELQERVSCPEGSCEGLYLVPDACLRPFDPDSAPEERAEVTELVIDVPAVLTGGPA